MGELQEHEKKEQCEMTDYFMKAVIDCTGWRFLMW